MNPTWKALWTNAQKWMKPAGLAAAGIVALYLGALQPLTRARDVAAERSTGLASAPVSASLQENAYDHFSAVRRVGMTGGIAESKVASIQEMQVSNAASPPPPPPVAVPDTSDRKMIRTDNLELTVKHPAEAAEQIRQLALRLGGFLVTSETNGDADAAGASITIRVPAARFEEARNEIRKLGLRVASERVEAQDVTRQYVDQEAHLRNLRAEEEQYLAILKRAVNVKDTLAVSEQLGNVRGEIEEQQAEFETLSKQVETVAICVSLQAQADTKVFGLQWQPLYRLKVAIRNGLDAVADYTSTMTSFAFFLPSLGLWLATILAGAAIGWRILRWSARIIFGTRKPATGAGSAIV